MDRMVNKKNIAIIPARGGSKRIPKKSILDFLGKPLIAWTIEAALNAGIFDRVLVSTDDIEIAKVAENYGVKVPFLRDRCFDDHSPVSSATISALNQVENILQEKYEIVIQLMPNCPLRRSEHIINAYNNFLNTGSLFQISCFKFGWMNPWWAFKLDEKLQPSPLFPGAHKMRSQDLPELYCPTGAIWIADVKALKAAGSFYGESNTFYSIDWKAAIDIDDMSDLEMAKAVFFMETSQ